MPKTPAKPRKPGAKARSGDAGANPPAADVQAPVAGGDGQPAPGPGEGGDADRAPAEVKLLALDAEPVDLEECYPNARNSRVHSEEQKVAQAAAMRRYGWTMPMLLRSRAAKEIIAGHLRWEVGMERLGLKQGPAIYADGWSEEMIRAYVIWDNRSAEMSTWDVDTLQLEVGELAEAGFDLGLVGFTLDEVKGMELEPGASGGGAPGDPIGEPPPGAYREQFGVVVVCKDEPEQQSVYERLRDQGLTVKVVKV